jgi:hypothetical protein
VDRVVAAVIPEGIQGAASAQKRGFKTILRAGRHGDVPGTDSMRAKSQYLLEINEEKRRWLKTHITHLLQSMEVPTEIYPGRSLVPVLFRKATPSLQLTRGTCTCQFNIQRAQLPPGMSHAELRRCMTGEQRTDLIEVF